MRLVLHYDMVTHMKTTIDIADSVLESAKATAAREGTTLRALVEEGLREVLGKRRAKAKPFKLRDASVGGNGLQPGVDLADWESIRRLAYGDRGG